MHGECQLMSQDAPMERGWDPEGNSYELERHLVGARAPLKGKLGCFAKVVKQLALPVVFVDSVCVFLQIARVPME
jgi:hypothetical protein